jgi:hypothetical protein
MMFFKIVCTLGMGYGWEVYVDSCVFWFLGASAFARDRSGRTAQEIAVEVHDDSNKVQDKLIIPRRDIDLMPKARALTLFRKRKNISVSAEPRSTVQMSNIRQLKKSTLSSAELESALPSMSVCYTRDYCSQ